MIGAHDRPDLHRQAGNDLLVTVAPVGEQDGDIGQGVVHLLRVVVRIDLGYARQNEGVGERQLFDGGR